MKRIVVVTFIIFSLLHIDSKAGILYVRPEGLSIIETIYYSQPGDTVILYPGIYNEKIVELRHNITLSSIDIFGQQNPPAQETTIIDGSGLGYDGFPLIAINHPGYRRTVINGLTLRNNDNYGELIRSTGGGVTSTNSDITISNCLIENNSANYCGAISCINGDIEIIDCTINNNHADNVGGISISGSTFTLSNNIISYNISRIMDGGGFCISGSCGQIDNNIFSNNSAGYYGGAGSLARVGLISIIDNEFIHNTAKMAGGGLDIFNVDSLQIRSNIFMANASGYTDENIYYYNRGGAIFLRSTDETDYTLLEHNTIVSNSSASALLLGSNNLEITGNMLVGNKGPGYSLIEVSTPNNLAATVNIRNNCIKYTRRPDNINYPYYGAITVREPSTAIIEHNDFIKNALYAVGFYIQPGEIVLGVNYWGFVNGPWHCTLNPEGEGDSLDINLSFPAFTSFPYWQEYLEFEPSEINYGSVPAGEPEILNIQLNNISDIPLNIKHLKLLWDNNFSIPDNLQDIVLHPNDSILIPVTFAPTETIEYFNVLSTVSLNHNASGTCLELSGNGLNDSGVKQNNFIPESFKVSHVFPNPFNNQTRLNVSIAEPGKLNITVYDINGRQVKQVTNGYKYTGNHEFNLDFSDLSSGIYFARILTDKHSVTRKLLLIQ